MSYSNDLTLENLFDTLSELGLEYVQKGDEINLRNCPFCERGNEKKSPHFSFNAINLVYNCFKCNEKGNLYSFRQSMGLKPIKENPIVIPDQARVSLYRNQPEEYYKAFQKKRGISVETLKKYGVGQKELHGKPYRTYQYVDADGIIVNVKYISADKKMQMEKDAKRTYYGMQFLDYSNPDLIITEGEDDCHAMVDYGWYNVVSLPIGAGKYDDNLHEIDKKFKRIFLVCDNDKVGQKGAEAIARKIGLWKCWNVLLPFKDARECLINGVSEDQIKKAIAGAKQFDLSHEKCAPAVGVEKLLEALQTEERNNSHGIQFNLGLFDELTGGLRPGSLTTILANPSCYKTTTLMNMLVRGCQTIRQDEMAIFFSFEMDASAVGERFAQIMLKAPNYKIRENARVGGDEWDRQCGLILRSCHDSLFITNESYLSISEIIEVVKKTEDVTGKKCALIGIDYLDFIRSDQQKEYDAVRQNMNEIKAKVSRGLNLATIVLCQTNRTVGDNSLEVGMRSGKGGTGIEAASDYLLGVWNDNGTVCGRFAKHRRIDDRYFEADIKRKSNPYCHLEYEDGTLYLKTITYWDGPADIEKTNSSKHNYSKTKQIEGGTKW